MYGWKKIEILRGTKVNYTDTDNQLKNILSSTTDEFLDEDEKPCLLMVIMKQWQRLDKMISIFTHANDNGIDITVYRYEDMGHVESLWGYNEEFSEAIVSFFDKNLSS